MYILKSNEKIEITPTTHLSYKTVLYGTCKICGKEFRRIYKNRKKALKPLCGKCLLEDTIKQRYGVLNVFASSTIKEKIKATNIVKYGAPSSAQNKQVKKKAIQTNLKKYGSENPFGSKQIQEKIKKTNIKKYGVAYPLQSKKIQEKVKQTNLKKYGVENPMQDAQIREKASQTLEKNYGVPYFSQSKRIQRKIKQTNLERYGVENPAQSKDIQDKTRQTNFIKYYNSLVDKLSDKIRPLFNVDDYRGIYAKYKWQCLTCGTIFEDNLISGKIPRCPNCFPKLNNTSKYEDDIENWLKSYNLDIKRNIKIEKREIDIFLPGFQLGIEFDGLYWHGEIVGQKGKGYHLHKTELAKKHNINLIHIFEDEWIDKQNIVKSIILNKLGIENKIFYARKLQVKTVGTSHAREFMEDNHLQGYKGGSIKLGLFDKELLSLIIIGKPRYKSGFDCEIIRFANKKGVSVVGGFSRLISKIDGSIITYADARYFTGEVYKQANFEFSHLSKPNYYYVNNGKRYSRIQFQKHKLREKLDIFDPILTEWQNMQLNGWDRIWDCGNYVYIKK